MNEAHDAYGQEIWAYLQGKENYEVVEREDGFVGLSGGAKSYFAEYKDWTKHQQIAISYAKNRVLDIGCGAGRHSLYLQSQGYDVTGIDNSPLAIKVCQTRGLKKTRLLSISEVDKLELEPVFDTIIMLGNNFGLFGGFKESKAILGKLHKITSSDALIIAESNDPHKTDDVFHLEYQEFNRKRGRMSGQLRIRIRYRKYIGEWFDYLLVSKDEMQHILKDSGWKVKKFIDSENSEYIALIEKIKIQTHVIIC